MSISAHESGFRDRATRAGSVRQVCRLTQRMTPSCARQKGLCKGQTHTRAPDDGGLATRRREWTICERTMPPSEISSRSSPRMPQPERRILSAIELGRACNCAHSASDEACRESAPTACALVLA